MRAILISIRPKWCAKIMNGDKTVEVRKGTALYKATKKLIDEYGYAEFYVYCTKDNKNLLHKNCVDIYWVEDKDFKAKNKKIGIKTQPYLNGKVVFKFRCYKVEEIKLPYTKFGSNEWVGCEEERKWQTPTMNEDKLLDLSCLEELELYGYLKGKTSTAIHISDLEIFDKPKELSEFEHYNLTEKSYRRFPYCDFNLTKAPQSWCYVDVGEQR